MADKDKFLATFRIDQAEWKDFMAQAKAGGSSASAVLVDFISWYRTGNRIAADTKSSTNLDEMLLLHRHYNYQIMKRCCVREASPLGRSADRILKSLITGKGKVATTSPQYKTAARALDRFIEELRESAPASIPVAETTPDGTTAPLMDEANTK